MTGKRRDDFLPRLSVDYSVKNAYPVDAEHIREHSADANTVTVQDLVDAVAKPGAVVDHPPDGSARADAGTGAAGPARQAELANASQPHAVGDIGFPALDLLDVLRVQQVDVDTGVFQRGSSQ